MRKRIADAMSALNDVERDVVSSRSLQAVPATLTDLSERLGISKNRLRQIERRALARLKKREARSARPAFPRAGRRINVIN